jgi:hypothetical protein
MWRSFKRIGRTENMAATKYADRRYYRTQQQASNLIFTRHQPKQVFLKICLGQAISQVLVFCYILACFGFSVNIQIYGKQF